MDPADDGRPRPAAGRRRHPLGRRHRRQLRRADADAARRRRRPRRRRPLQPARPAASSARPTAAGSSRCATPSPASSAPSAPGSSSSAPAAARCPCCSGPASRRSRGFGGFPVSGKFLRTTSPELVSGHQAKVYGQAAVGAPPMSVPHLDLRLIDGDHSLMFGPYAGFSPKFLKAGSMFDLPRSVRAEQPGLDARRGPDRAGAHPLPGPRADAVRRRPAPDPGATSCPRPRSTTGRWSPPASGSR